MGRVLPGDLKEEEEERARVRERERKEKNTSFAASGSGCVHITHGLTHGPALAILGQSWENS